ncbi:MAG: hypothetical protein HZB21_05575, partial [Deltaproteobacteria bacterium]|nr:hypothetical protein [Deltaproteobacteria bacterium]
MALERLTERAASLFRDSFLLITAYLMIVTAASASVGSIGAVSGGAYHMAKGSDKWAAAEKKAPLDVGDRVKTGPDGRAVLEFEGGTKLSLGNGTEVEITEFLLKKRARSA